jgi:hypothetical protein
MARHPRSSGPDRSAGPSRTCGARSALPWSIWAAASWHAAAGIASTSPATAMSTSPPAGPGRAPPILPSRARPGDRPGQGTGYYLAQTLDALPHRHGVCVYLSAPALRRGHRRELPAEPGPRRSNRPSDHGSQCLSHHRGPDHDRLWTPLYRPHPRPVQGPMFDCSCTAHRDRPADMRLYYFK